MSALKRAFKIGKKTISAETPTYIIAEIGSNHDCDIDEAIRHVHAAKEAGADAVKFQSFTAEGLISRKRPIGNDPKKGWEPHPAFPILEKLALPVEWHHKLKQECDKIGIDFLSAPFEIGRARLLKEIGCPAIKIASGELTNVALLREVAGYRIPIILSSGIATVAEVQQALDILSEGGATDVVVLHCVSNYPPKFEEMNIRAIATMAQAFGVPVGISDHTPGWTVPVLALALGSRCIEKHVTFDRNNKGPDHPYALEWPEFAMMVKEIRNGEMALGNGIKGPSPIEAPERIFARKGLYAAKDIAAGEALSEANTKLVRHAFGIKAPDAEKAYGLKTSRMIRSDEAVFWEDLKN